MLFNKEGMLCLDEAVQQSKSWQRMMADGIVSDEEIAEQSERVTSLLRQIDATFTKEQRECVEQLLTEASVLYTAYHVHAIQEMSK